LILQPARAAASAVIQNDSAYVDVAGYYHVLGEVSNTGDSWLSSGLFGIKVTATLRDQGGNIVDVIPAFLQISRLPPGQSVGFDTVEIDTAKSAQVASYTLTMEYQAVAAFPISLQISSVNAAKNTLGWFEVMGEVQNDGSKASHYTKVVATFYGSDGKVVYVWFAYTEPTTVEPGMKAPFKISVLSQERSDLITRYSLAAESSEYTSIPEFPSQILIAVGMLAITAFALRFRRSARTRVMR